jgi:hypothetical protein
VRAPLARKFPTGALATYEVETRWSTLAPETTRLVAYVTPADLDVD